MLMLIENIPRSKHCYSNLSTSTELPNW